MSSASAECKIEPRLDHRVSDDQIEDRQPRSVSAAVLMKHQFSATMLSRAMLIDDEDGPEAPVVYNLGRAERRGRAEVGQLKRRGFIKDAVARDGLKIIKFLFKPNTVYASIAEDDNGLIFYWRAGEMSIEIDVFPGEGFWWSVSNVAHESYQGSGYELETERLKHSLNQFSKEVEVANPAWREQKF